jgi:hypothetical protein
MILARVLSATPTTDGEHVDLTARHHYDAWHTDAYGQNPAPFQKNPNTGRSGPPWPWRPDVGNVWGPFDSTFPNTYGFTVAVNASKSPTTLDISGATPANRIPIALANFSAPQVPLHGQVSNTGGSIVTGTYLISISASAGGPLNQFLVKAVVPASVTAGVITIAGIVWTAAAPSIQIFVGTSALAMHSIAGASWAGSVNDTFGNPTTFTISVIDPDGFGLPDSRFDSFLFRVKDIIHGGVWGWSPVSVASVGGHATATFFGAGWTTNQWAGYTLASYGAGSGISGIGPRNWPVLSNTADTLTFGANRGPGVGVAVVMRAAAAHISPTTIGDDNFVNWNSGGLGLTAHAEAGKLLRIIAGAGAGQPPYTILDNSSTVFAILGAWTVMPDATSVYIVEAPNWRYDFESGSIQNDGSGTAALVAQIPVPNFQRGQLLVQALTVDPDGNISVEAYAPLREIFVDVPTVQVSEGYYTVVPVAGVATVDLSNGSPGTSGAMNQRVVLNATAVTIAAPVFSTGTITDGLSFTLFLDQDATGGRAIPTFDAAFDASVATWQIDGTLSTRTAYSFVRTNGVWGLTGPPLTGGPVT